MGLDSNGIWQYDESETNAPISTVLNRLGGSVSAALEQLLVHEGPTTIAADSGSGFTGTLTFERVGRQVEVTGSFTPSTNWGTANSAQQPIAGGSGIGYPLVFAPAGSLTFTCPSASGTAATTFRVNIQSNGGVQVRCDTASYTGGVSISLGWKAPEV